MASSPEDVARAHLALLIHEREVQHFGIEPLPTEAVLADAGLSLVCIAQVTGRNYETVKTRVRRHRVRPRRSPLDVRTDEVNTVILRRSRRWIAAGDLKAAVAQQCQVSEATVKRRVADLLEVGALTSQGATRTLQYRADVAS